VGGGYFDDTEAIAAQLEIVGGNTSSNISKVKGRLAMIRSSRIRIRNKHVRKRQAIKDASSIISNIMQSRALTIIETYAESPFLPLDDVPVNRVRGAFGLNDIVGLEAGALGADEIVEIFVALGDLVVRLRGRIERVEEGQTDDLVDLAGRIVNSGRKVKRDGIMIAFGVIVRGIPQVHVTLPFPRLIIVAIGAVGPGITSDDCIFGQVQSFQFPLHFGGFQGDFLDLEKFGRIGGSMAVLGNLSVADEFPSGEIDDGLEGLVGVEEVVQDVGRTGDNWQGATRVFGFEVRNDKGLGGFVQSNRLEVDWRIGGIRVMEDFRGFGDFAGRKGVEGMESRFALYVTVCRAVGVTISRCAVDMVSVRLGLLALPIEFFGDGGRKAGNRVLEGFSCSGRSHLETVCLKPFDDCNNGGEPFQGTGSIQAVGFLLRRIIRGAGPTGYIG
jgi:hypothetical protein